MSEDLPDFLSEDPAPTPEHQAAPPEPNPQEAPAVEAPQEPTAPAAVENPAPEPQKDAPQPDAPVHTAVPITALLDEREKRQAAERRAEMLERQNREREAQAAKPVPDRFDDPEGYERHQQAALNLDMFVQRRDMSRMVAETKFGEETVQAAFDRAAQRCDADPHFNQRVMQSTNPAAFVVQEYQAEQRAAKLADVDPSELEAFQAWRATQAGQQPAPNAAAPVQQRPQAPSPSLAAAPSAGNRAEPNARDGQEQFQSMFQP